MATKEQIQADIDRVSKKKTDPNTIAYFNKNYGGIDSYLASQQKRLDELEPKKEVVNQEPVTAPKPSNNYINDLNNARRNQVMADLDKSRNQSLSNLNREYSTIQPQYYDQRNQATARNAQGARNFAEFMATRGGTNAGSNAQAEMNNNMAYQGEIGLLKRQEQSAYDDINRRRTDVNNAYNSDLASANAGIEAERLQQLIDEQRYRDSLALQEGSLLGNYKGQRTLEGQSLDYARDSDLWNRDFSREQFDYGKTRDTVGDNQWQQQFDFTKRQTDLDNAFRQQQLEQDAKQFAQSMGYNWASLNQREREYFTSLAEEQRQFDANLSQRQSEFNYDRSQQQDPYFNNYQSKVESIYNKYAIDQYSTPEQIQKRDNEIKNYLQGLDRSGVSEGTIRSLMQIYGLYEEPSTRRNLIE